MEITKQITGWLTQDELQTYQDSFSNLTGMSLLILGDNGNVLLPAKNDNPFCSQQVACSKAGNLCPHISRYGAKETDRLGKASFYFCHMGLVEFSAPIYVDEKEIATLIGGQCFITPPEKEKIYALAQQYDIDPEQLWLAAKKLPVLPASTVVKASELMFDFSRIITNSIKNRQDAEAANREIEKAGQMKSDFLANMSHEIRTPMNAVIGMADIALQEEMSPAATEYIQQIQNSGKALLHIINDILDYSKITSGKLDIFEEEYDPYIMLRDVFSIIMNRLQHKAAPIELLVDIDKNLPSRIIGDNQRIRQILINLANNAVKFTNEGSISINIRVEKTSPDEIMLTAEVIDTGIGIRKEDQAKLFQSFSQVDSKRNRNVEGTGLGLAITQQLLELMHGSISISSEYGVGSNFSFKLPQKIANATPVAQITEPEKFVIAGVFSNELLAHHFQNTIEKMGIYCKLFFSCDDLALNLSAWLEEASGREAYLFVDQGALEKGVAPKLNSLEVKSGSLHKYLLTLPFSDESSWKDLTNFNSLKKPFHFVNLANLLQDNTKQKNTKEAETTDARQLSFIAPNAQVLIVDDNSMNLRVASKLLERMQIKADTASSGKIALEMIMLKRYDLIFMDHMMPELDGIDTTRILRRFHPKMNSIPIIALTANAMGDARKIFLEEGMNDFLAKPIEVNLLKEKVFRWLPKSLIIEDEENTSQP